MTIKLDCTNCGTHLVVKDEMGGKQGKCSKCGQMLRIPVAARASAIAIKPVANQSPASPPAQLPRHDMTSRHGGDNGTELVSTTARSSTSQMSSTLAVLVAKFANEEQDPNVVAQIVGKIEQILTRGEELLYVAVQKRPVINVAPDGVVLTNKRFIMYRSKLLGRFDFDDYIWRDLHDAKLKEGVLGSEISVKTSQGQVHSIGYLPKAQARILYRFAQEMEENAFEERRHRKMEENRAAAGGVVVQTAAFPSAGPSPPPADDPMTKLKQLKDMMDAGLITPQEYGPCKQSCVSQQRRGSLIASFQLETKHGCFLEIASGGARQ